MDKRQYMLSAGVKKSQQLVTEAGDDLSTYSDVDVITTGENLDASDSTVTLEETTDGENWTAVPAADTTVAQDGTVTKNLTGQSAKQYRANYTPNSATQGRVTIRIVAKK